MARFLPVFLLLIVMAAVMRDDFAMILVYLFAGAAAAGAWWSMRSLAQVSPVRKTGTHAFLGEKIQIKLHLENRGWLPVLWLHIQDELPVALSAEPHFAFATSLAPGAGLDLSYNLDARKRGYYAIGPLQVSSGDILGLHADNQLTVPAQYLTVYPKIIPLSTVAIPSRSPQGTLRHNQRIFEDPTRIFGKREYTSGDSLRRVDWKTTASTGRLQVKQYEPSISLETCIFLDLNSQGFPSRGKFDASELAIMIAASLANWISARQQAVGLRVNGRDPLASDGKPVQVPPARGRAHLMRILEILARVELADAEPLSRLVQNHRIHMSWGTTLIAITGSADDTLLDELYQARRAGQETLLILAGNAHFDQAVEKRAARFGIPLIWIPNERALDIWRR